MNSNRRRIILQLLPIADVLLAPFVYPAAWLLKLVRQARVDRLPKCRNALWRVGVFPIRDHYYEPQIDNRQPKRPFSQERTLPGIDWNTIEQLELMTSFSFTLELADIPHEKPETLAFYLNNTAFMSGDAE